MSFGIDIKLSDLARIVVAVDPAVTATEDSDDTGIVVVGRGPHQPSTCKIPFCPGHGYVLDDLTCHELPTEAMKTAVGAYHKWKADRVVGETNNGGDYIGELLHAVEAGIPYSKMTATRGKRTRAEPVAALSDQGRLHFMGFPKLEMQLTTWNPEMADSPDRLDALVWGVTALGLIGGQGAAFMAAWQEELAQQGPQTPEELKMLPKLASEMTHRLAAEKCKDGGRHRFMEYGDGGYQCAKCGGWLAEV